MKKLFIYIVLVLGFSACSEGFLDVNENPNVATAPPLDGLLASTSLNTGLNTYNVSTSFTSYFVQYLASPNEGSTTDVYLEANYSGTWGAIYQTLADLSDMKDIGREGEAFHHVGVANVLTAINLGLLVDNWGDVPFSNALRGDVLTPTYDDQETIYATIQSLLDEAITNFNNEANARDLDEASDFMHEGNIDNWIKTASVLKARYFNHLSKTGSYNPDAVLSALSSGYTSNDDDAQITRFEVRNPWAQVATNNENLVLDGWLSSQFVDALNGTSFGVLDPRLPLLTDTVNGGGYTGTENGAGRTSDGTGSTESYLETDRALSMDESPLLVVTYAEAKFIEAEAAFRADQKERAFAAFQEGIKANMDKIGVSEADYEAYLEAAYPSLTEATLDLETIFKEKYVVMFLHPESWVDVRRNDYNYVDFTLPQNAALSTFIRRVQYPDTETSRNPGNVPSITDLSSRLFWDQ